MAARARTDDPKPEQERMLAKHLREARAAGDFTKAEEAEIAALEQQRKSQI